MNYKKVDDGFLKVSLVFIASVILIGIISGLYGEKESAAIVIGITSLMAFPALFLLGSD
jgi:ABC-type dipeptide/oligopeptide/nickel transport system permease subunit